ncbi:uncharacterized protein LOC111707329 [Eurytemora carolleeae]|uniref:uncharacterized protein LOC111707329 n=1 Tax=Eurytemora carolleeae TaxID=1294199 RepID=UPI000C785353|nr:uncharacterized protein LOC111707329 [Eurytemora carolleeae]|eukprot:XP_023336184.1 uncharacterized protein LOC111707329 [Eurytemora affinis]
MKSRPEIIPLHLEVENLGLGTARVSDQILVILPDQYPSIKGLSSEAYEPGFLLSLNCTSSPSYPAADLTWYIGDAQAQESLVTKYLRKTTETGLEISTLGFNLEIDPKLGKDGTIVLTCSATLPEVHGDQMIMYRSISIQISPGILYSQLSCSNPHVCDIVILVILRLIVGLF